MVFYFLADSKVGRVLGAVWGAAAAATRFARELRALVAWDGH